MCEAGLDDPHSVSESSGDEKDENAEVINKPNGKNRVYYEDKVVPSEGGKKEVGDVARPEVFSEID